MVSRVVLCAVLAACAPDPSLTGTMTRDTVLDAAFHQEPRWLGGDGAYAIDLGDDRALWLFGDSFIATSPELVRTQSTMVRNSIAVMTGRDLSTAKLEFAWRDTSPPTSFFPEAGDHWFWPSEGLRAADGSVIVFLNELAPSSDGLGFEAAGVRAVRIANLEKPPSMWLIDPLPWVRSSGSIACTFVYGNALVAVLTLDDSHDGYLVRWPLDAIAEAEPVRFGSVIPDGGSECSIHQDAETGIWVYLWSRGFGATTIAIRTTPDLEGEWSDAEDVFTPPESGVDDAFVYAGKAHPFLANGDGIIVTYADNSFTFGDLFEPANANTLYWPHVATLMLSAR